MGWVGSGHTKWTRGQLWFRLETGTEMSVSISKTGLVQHQRPYWPLIFRADCKLADAEPASRRALGTIDFRPTASHRSREPDISPLPNNCPPVRV